MKKLRKKSDNDTLARMAALFAVPKSEIEQAEKSRIKRPKRQKAH